MLLKKSCSALFGFSLSFCFLASSYALEWFMHFQPCPLCLLQRAALFAILFFFMIDFFARGFFLSFIAKSFAFIFSCIGMALAGRQIWLQHFAPPNSIDCLVSIDRMLDVLPWNEVLYRILAGSSDCAERSQQIFSIDLSVWSFGAFLLLAVVSVTGWVYSVCRNQH